MKELVILDALRTPIGKYKGALSEISTSELGVMTVKELIKRTAVNPKDIAQVIFGSALQAGQGQNIARQIVLKSGLSFEVPGTTINEVCGSGMKSVLFARQLIALDEAELIIAGGSENMSQAETLKEDGLTDAYTQEAMGNTAEQMAEQYQISRKAQDLFAFTSHQKALAADFSHEMMMTDILQYDENIRPNTSLEKMAALSPVFKENGSLTAANTSSINDGASAVLLSSNKYAKAHGLSVLALIRAAVEVGVEPIEMSISPIKAIRELLKKSQLVLEEIDIFEINEAFAASSIIIENELGLNSEKVNPLGGALALGHPLGMTGARLLTSLSHQLHDRGKKYGIASLCIGGGMGLAVLLENPNV